MKKSMVVCILALLLGISFGISTASAALDIGRIGQALGNAGSGSSSQSSPAAALQPRSKDVPTEAQIRSDADYVNVGRIYYKKSSMKVLSKNPNGSKIQVSVYEVIGGRLMITDYLFECELDSSKKHRMYETFLGARTYDEKTGSLTSKTGAGGKVGSTKSFDTGKLSGILYKQVTGKNPPEFY
jgi:hypothetical protein